MLLLLSAVSVYSHPHVFVEASAGIEFQDGNPAAVHVRWVFDDFFSRMILLDFAGGADTLTEQHIESIRTGAFENLRDYNYFTHILLEGDALNISKVQDFHVDVDGRSLIYSFRIPLQQPGGTDISNLSRINELVVGLYDNSYYSYFDYPGEPITFQGNVPASVQYDQRERPDRRYYFGLIVPEMFHIRWN